MIRKGPGERPPLQNIPIATVEGAKLRQAFGARPEMSFLFDIDYEKLERALLDPYRPSTRGGR